MRSSHLPILLLLAATSLALGCRNSRQDGQRIEGNLVRLQYKDSFDSWMAELNVPGNWHWDAGSQVDLPVHFDAHVPLLSENLAAWDGLYVVLWGERIYDDRGLYKQQSGLGVSSFLTPSGLPVQSFQWDPPVGALGAHYRSPIEGVAYFSKNELHLEGDRLRIDGRVAVKIESDCPEGYFRTHVRLMAKVAGGRGLIDVSRLPMAFSRYMASAQPGVHFDDLLGYQGLQHLIHPAAFLPPIRVGQPQAPKIPIALFSGTTASGIRGILSSEYDSHLGLTRRSIYRGRLILPPGSYPLDPSPVTYFPQNAIAEPSGGNSHVPTKLPHFMDFSKGELSVRIIAPDGKIQDLGRGNLLGEEEGILRWSHADRITLSSTGEYRVEIDGWTSDLVGNRYEIAGTYSLYCALPLSFSTAAKIGTSFFVGGQFPPKVQVHPLVPAYVKLHIRYFPQSDASRVREVVQEGYANAFGYFIPGADQPTLRFDEPGEYAVDIVAAWKDEQGQLWMGSQTAAGVVAEENPQVQLHGFKINFEGLSEDRPERGLQARFEPRDENSLGNVRPDFTDCHDTPPPYHSGDVMYLATTLDGSNNINPTMSQSSPRPDVIESILGMFSREPSFVTHNSLGVPTLPRFRDGILKLLPFSEAFFLTEDPLTTKQLPILSRHRKGLSPYNYPEDANVLNYYYLSAIRPGFPAFTAVSDSTAFESYWSPSPNSFARVMNAGPTGDLPQDVYRLDAGLVYRDKDSGISSYSAYASNVVILPRESYANRTVAPAAEPLVRVNGEDYPLFLAVEAAAVLSPGDPLALAAVVFPPVAAKVQMSITNPRGEKTTVTGDANSIGIFAPRDGVTLLEQPGVYSVDAQVMYNGKTGGAYGSFGKPYYHFVAAPDRPDILSLKIPEHQGFKASDDLEIPIEVATEVRDPILTWVVMCPGIIMDQGREKISGNKFRYRFMPTQFAAQFPNYQVVDYQSGEPVLAKTTMLVFFVEGTNAQGQPVHDVRYVILRKRDFYAPTRRYRPNEPSKSVLDGIFVRTESSTENALASTSAPAAQDHRTRVN